MKTINKICLASVATLILGSAILSSRAIAEDAIFTVRANAVIELTVPSIVNLNLYPTTGSDFNTASMDISVGTNNPTGYTLTMTADSDTLTRTGSITDGSNNTYTPTILPMLTTGSATGYTAAQFESSTTDAYTLNRWGYKLSTATNFMPMTTTTTELSTTNAPSNGDTVTLDFAAKVDTTKPAGTYQTTLNFNAVTNYVPLTCNPTGTTINTIVCMQDLNTTNYNSILASMTVNQQYQLFDNRDEKQYYVAKLADGNIWMTQNLDHDIVTTANFYTPQNTDISANWTAQTATYATNNTSWGNKVNNPESYDPGDLCWDGTLGDKTLTTGTTACGNDRHMHVGNYYNWTAAAAMNDSSSFITDQQDVGQSICPAGWRLPTYSGNKSYTNLVTTLSLTAGTSGNIQSSPVYFVYGGYWSGSSIYVGSLGFYWSSVARDSSDAMGFLFNRDNYMNSNAHVDRSSSNPVRCVARSPKTIQSLTYMQDFATLTSKEKTEVLSSMTQNQQYQLKDNRDQKDYYIAKLADGNVWMTQNLDHDIVTTANFYTPQNTDILANWTASTATYATNDTTWIYSVEEPESYDPGDLCWNGTIAPDYSGTLSTYAEACGNNKHYHIGNYYNWTAAVAMNDSSSYIAGQQDVDQSICPAGWRLPTYSGDKSYANLRTALSLTSGASGNVQNAPAYFGYVGYWEGESSDVGGSGTYWSSVVSGGGLAYGFYFDRDGNMYLRGNDTRDYGNLVRCVAR